MVLSAGWCSLPWHLCFVFPWSSSPAVLGMRGSRRGQSLLSCIAAKQRTAGSHDSHGRSFTCLVTHQHAMRLDASAGFRCVLLITCSVSVGMPVALPEMVTSIALAAWGLGRGESFCHKELIESLRSTRKQQESSGKAANRRCFHTGQGKKFV